MTRKILLNEGEPACLGGWKIIVISFFALFSSGYGTIYAADSLETAIKKEGSYIIKNSPQGSTVAIVSIKSDSKLLSEYIMEKLPDYVVNNKGGITFVERSKLDLLQKEIDFQYSGEVSDATMVSIGKKIGAQVIIAGTVIGTGTTYNFSIKLFDVETAKILGSQSVQIKHDNVMQGFLSNSNVAKQALADAQKKRQQREAMILNIKDALGIFSNGFYIGYLGSYSMPIGISFGGITEESDIFFDIAFGPPDFRGYEHSDSFSDGLSYTGNTIKNPQDECSYFNENEKTAFVLDMVLGGNINIVRNILWTNIGGGLEYRRDYKLFTETSVTGSNKIWAADDKLKLLVSAGLYVKVWYFYIQGKYKYVIGDEIDFSGYGLNQMSIGIGYVWRRD